MQPILIVHVIAVETLLLTTIIKTVLLWTKKEKSYDRMSRLLNWPVRLLFLTGVCSGIYMFKEWYGFNLADWLAVKLGILILALVILLAGEKRKSKWMMTIACFLFISIIVIANLKQQFIDLFLS